MKPIARAGNKVREREREREKTVAPSWDLLYTLILFKLFVRHCQLGKEKRSYLL